LGWTPQPGFGYLFSTQASAGAPLVLVSRTNDPARASVRFSKGAFSYEVAVITKGYSGVYPTVQPNDTAAPSVPSNVRTSGLTQTAVTVSWDASTDNVAVAGYRLYRGTALVFTGTALQYQDSGLACATPYQYGVEAFDAAGNVSSRAVVSVTTSVCNQPPPNEPAPIAGQGYHVAFDEQFTTFTPGTWETGIWYSPGAPAGSITAANGILTLSSKRSDGYPDITVTTEAGSSPRVFTQGYFEARMRWTKGAGAWPAFWLISYRHSVNPSYPSINPYCAQNGLPAAQCWSAELDVFEGQGTEPSIFYGTIHRNSCNCYGVQNTQNGNNYHDVGVDLTAAFHTYGMLWTASTISWYLDGNLVGSAPTYDSTNQPMFILLQMWIGGWTSGTNSSTPAELKTEVDWVRAWQK
jgi:chitodextrinase